MKKSFLKVILAATVLFGLEALADGHYAQANEILPIYSEGMRCKGYYKGYAHNITIYTQVDNWGQNVVKVPSLISNNNFITMGHYSGVLPLKKAGDHGVLSENVDGYWRTMNFTVTVPNHIQATIVEGNETYTYNCIDIRSI